MLDVGRLCLLDCWLILELHGPLERTQTVLSVPSLPLANSVTLGKLCTSLRICLIMYLSWSWCEEWVSLSENIQHRGWWSQCIPRIPRVPSKTLWIAIPIVFAKHGRGFGKEHGTLKQVKYMSSLSIPSEPGGASFIPFLLLQSRWKGCAGICPGWWAP